jgi:hypothetical protein
MKRIILLFLVTTLPCLAAYDKKLVHVLEQLRACTFALDEEQPMVGGAAVGAAGSPHEFYLLFPYVLQVASEDDLRAMIRDRSPVVRIMGAACILKKEDKDLAAELDILGKDTATLYVAPFGCAVLKQSVAETVAEMKKTPHYFDGAEEPNQAPEPMPLKRHGSP